MAGFFINRTIKPILSSMKFQNGAQIQDNRNSDGFIKEICIFMMNYVIFVQIQKKMNAQIQKQIYSYIV
jgi:hypothetical protein